MPAALPMIPGERFGRLTIIEEVEASKSQGRMARFKCDCGVILTLPFKAARSGNTSSCGCLRREMVAAKNSKHGMRKRGGDNPPECIVWKQMRARCNNPHSHRYELYGGLGVKVHPRWDDFPAFLADMGPRPSDKHSIDRIDPNGDYEPGNTRWATASQQARNKRNTLKVTLDGREWAAADLAEKHGVPYGTFTQRLRKGWSVERAISEPIVFGKNQHGSP